MRDGFQFIGRIPFPKTEPKELLIASEVATLDYLRLHDVPVPKVYGYSTTSDNATGTEYIFMEFIRGNVLGDVWFKMSGDSRLDILTKLVELEARLFALRFPASGSLYYAKDVPIEYSKVNLPLPEHLGKKGFCIGPDLTFKLWYGRRRNLRVDRGPCQYKSKFLPVSLTPN
jgi:hypothetical protein